MRYFIADILTVAVVCLICFALFANGGIGPAFIFAWATMSYTAESFEND